MKKISIFVPVYNCEEYLEECLESIENQTFNKEEIEVIIINDGSSDKSLDIINNFSKKNPDWIIRSRENKGVAITRNEGLDLVNGEYLMFLDSDDYLEKDALSNIYKELMENNSDIGIFKTNYFDKKNNYGEINKSFFSNGKIITSLKEMPSLVKFIRNAAIIYKKEIIKQVRFIPDVVHEDNYFCVKSYSLANKVYISDTHVYNIRKREGESLSIMQQLNFKTYKDFLINVIKEDKEIKSAVIIKIHINQLIGYIRKNVSTEKIKEAKCMLYKYLKDLEKDDIISKLTYYRLLIYARLKCLMHLDKKVLKQDLSKFGYTLLTLISPKLNTKVIYKNRIGKDINLKEPKLFNEKIQYLKLYELPYKDIYVNCADKYLVREFVKERGCKEILIKLLGVYDSPSEINFKKLPKKFVLKWNFGCGLNILCHDKNKLDEEETKKKLKKWRKNKFYIKSSELHYKKIKKKIICEELIGDNTTHQIDDYKFYCFDGNAYCVMVCVGRDSIKNQKPRFYFFDKDYKWLKINKQSLDGVCDFDLSKVKNIDKMFEYAEKLSQGFKFVRVDLYNVNGKIYFGELTFTPSAGVDTGYTEEGNKLLGDKINL